MSRIIGTGSDAMLVAGGDEAPITRAQRHAVVELLRGWYLYGSAGCRGWNGCMFEALKALNPIAAQCLREEGVIAAWEKFGEKEEEIE